MNRVFYGNEFAEQFVMIVSEISNRKLKCIIDYEYINSHRWSKYNGSQYWDK